MYESLKTNPYTLTADDKVSVIMVYTPNALIRGEVVTRQIVRISTWMRTQAAPEYMRIYNAQVVLTNTSPFQTLSLQEIYIHANQILAYHLAPPASDPVDYDVSEPNRKMEPVGIHINAFRFNGHLRVATSVNVNKFMDTAREVYISCYDVEISNPLIPAMGIIKVPYVAVRMASVIISARSGA